MRERKECHDMFFLTPENDSAGTDRLIFNILRLSFHQQSLWTRFGKRQPICDSPLHQIVSR